jgi:hypothetical protein
VQIDTGSTDTAVAHMGIDAYTGPTLNFTIPSTQTSVRVDYYDTSFWVGYEVVLDVGLVGSTIKAPAAIAAISLQSTDPVFMDGTKTQGIMGLAYDKYNCV